MLSETMERKFLALKAETSKQVDPSPELKRFRKDSGVAFAHIYGVLRVCAERNIFLFLRPTDIASTRLIELGYATKSMDIHSKSSNWGPMKGMVPVDPAFNKLSGANPAEGKGPVDPHDLTGEELRKQEHGAAKTMPLSIDEALFKKLTGEGKPPREGKTYELVKVEGNVYRSTAQQANAAKVYFHLEPEAGSYRVSWSSRERRGPKYPLHVFGYELPKRGLKPVTGDYDMWMVSPHMAWWKLNAQVMLVRDEHGASAATLFSTWLLRELNKACGREDNPVFNHGAEQQNYGFTQGLDERVAMFTPGGTYRMVSRDELPQVMAELMEAFHLVLWNKRYGEDDPHLMHSPMSDEQAQQHRNWREEVSLRMQKEEKAWAELAGQDKTSDEKQRQIYTFFRTLRERMERPGEPLLKEEDFGDFLYLQPAQLRAMQRQLQEVLVSATTHEGESNVDELDGWVEHNLDTLEKMSAAFGPAPGDLPKESDFLPKVAPEESGLDVRVPDGVRWDAQLRQWICKACNGDAKQESSRCKTHPARRKQGKVCCPRMHPVDVPVPHCPMTLCILGCIDRAKAKKRMAKQNSGKR